MPYLFPNPNLTPPPTKTKLGAYFSIFPGC